MKTRPRLTRSTAYVRSLRLEVCESRRLLTRPAVSAVVPEMESHQAPLDGAIQVTFDQAIDAASVTADSLVVHGTAGRFADSPGAIDVDAETVRLIPPRDFFAGETVRASVTSGINNGGGEGARPFVWQFRVATTGGTGFLQQSWEGDPLSNQQYGDLGDVDNDGDLDVVMAGLKLEIFFNDGSGALTLGQAVDLDELSSALVLADVDGDGDLDAFVADGRIEIINNIIYHDLDTFWLNDGHGHFTMSDVRLFNEENSGAALGDLDGDGDVDLITITTWFGNYATVWINENMAFTPRRLDYRGSAVALADLDVDGDLDIVIGTPNHNSSQVWFNDGTARFTYSGQTFGIANTLGVALGDVDNDGDPDAVIADADRENNSIWLNDGRGRFVDSGQRLGDTSGRDVTLGDMDGDGDLDILFGSLEGTTVWLNDGQGRFAQTRHAIHVESRSISLGDLDADGDVDALFVAYPASRILINHPEPADLAVRISNERATAFPGDVVQYAVTITNHGPHDVSGASVRSSLSPYLLDAVWTSTATPGSTSTPNGMDDVDDVVDVLTGGSIVYSVTARVDPTISGPLPQSQVLSLASVTAPPEVFEYDSTNNHAGDTDMLLLPRQGGTGGFADSGQLLGAGDDQAVELADVDGDGDLDAFVIHETGSTELWFNERDGRYISGGSRFNQSELVTITPFDLDGDGDLDVARGAQFWLNNGAGEFTLSATTVPQWQGGMKSHFVDVNGDGQSDFVGTGDTGARVAMNLGEGGFSDAVLYGNYGDKFIDSTIGDFDNDGDVDVVLLQDRRPSDLWLNDGHGRFSESPNHFFMEFAKKVDSGDLDGDGDLDLFLGGYGGGTGTESLNADQVWVNDGSGVFTDSGQRISVSGTSDVRLGDLDGDGDLDVVGTEYTYDDPLTIGQLVYLNDGAGRFTVSGVDWGSMQSRAVRLGDLDGDGDLDAFVVGTGPATVWLNDGQAVDLAITIEEGLTRVFPGQQLDYVVTVENHGDTPVVGAAVETFSSDHLVDVTWTSVATPGSAATPSGSGPIRDQVTLLAGGRVTYTVSATVSAPDPIFAPIRLHASAVVTPPAGALDFFPANNAASDVDAVQVQPSPSEGVFQQGFLLQHAQYSHDVAVGDLDDDGDLDVVLAVGSGDSIWLNDGAGRLVPSGVLGTNGARAVALGDVDGDDDLDVVLAESRMSLGTGYSTVWLNDGHAAFTARTDRLLGKYASSVALADLDGDGDLDAFIQGDEEGFHSPRHAPQVWLNDGVDGYVNSGQTLDGDGSDAVLADLDGDGDVDAFTNGYYFAWLNDGRGYFTATSQIQENFPTFYSMDLGDLDADGDLDAFVVYDPLLDRPNRVWFNDGAARFVEGAQAIGDSGGENVVLGDLDGDADLDAIVVTLNGYGQEVWLNDGAGNFAESPHRLGGASANTSALGDFDADGDLDVLVVGNQGTSRVWLNYNGAYTDLKVSIQNGATSAHVGDAMTYTVTVENRGPAPVAAALVDVRFPAELSELTWTSVATGGAMATAAGAGPIDDSVTMPVGGIVTYTAVGIIGEAADAPPRQFAAAVSVTPPIDVFDPTSWNNSATDVDAFVLPAPCGYRYFVGAELDASNSAGRTVVLGDLDGDGDDDVVIANWGSSVEVLLNDGRGAFVPTDAGLGALVLLAAPLGDLDGDGDLDLLGLNNSTRIDVRLNDGAGVFTPSGQGAVLAHGSRAQLGDLDGDGDLDAFVYDSSGSFSEMVWLNDGQGWFFAAEQPLNDVRQSEFALGDLDGDGDLDLMNVFEGQFTIFINDGAGRFQFAQFERRAGLWAVDLGDIDQDGDLDAFFAGDGNGAQSVWVNDGTGVFSQWQALLHTGSGRAVKLGDLDADGDLDAFVATAGESPDEIWANDGFGYFIRTQQQLGAGNGVAVALGDLDSDGDLDAYVAQDGPDALWLNHPAPGDTYPFDGAVRLSDLNTVRNRFGAVGATDGSNAGDTFPFDGVVDLNDLNAARNFFGDSAPLPLPMRDAAAAETIKRTLSTSKSAEWRDFPIGPSHAGRLSAIDAVFAMLTRHDSTPNAAMSARRPRR